MALSNLIAFLFQFDFPILLWMILTLKP